MPSGPLYDMLSFQLAWRDEQGERTTSPDHALRLRASLCLLTCEALLGQYEPALPAAASVELIHNQAIVHEDIQVAHPERNRRPTVWWLWGPGQAINAGDGLHALGRLALLRLKDRGQVADKIIQGMEVLDRACIRMCEGQHMDLVFQERLDVGIESYLEMAAAKTGALMSCGAELGALIATESSEVRESCRQIGMDLGIAYQIRDDMLDLWGNGGQSPRGDSALSKKKSLPVVYALEQAEVPRKRELGTLYFKRVLEPSDLDRLLELLELVQARQYAEGAAEMHCQRAMERLTQLGIPPWAQDAFRELGQYIIHRDS